MLGPAKEQPAFHHNDLFYTAWWIILFIHLFTQSNNTHGKTGVCQSPHQALRTRRQMLNGTKEAHCTDKWSANTEDVQNPTGLCTCVWYVVLPADASHTCKEQMWESTLTVLFREVRTVWIDWSDEMSEAFQSDAFIRFLDKKSCESELVMKKCTWGHLMEGHVGRRKETEKLRRGGRNR